MNAESIRTSVQRHARAYRLLTRLFPATFRSDYEEPMVQLFRDHCREALTSDQPVEVLVLWCRVAGDTLMSLFREHLAALRRRLQGNHALSNTPLDSMNAAPARPRLPWYWIPALGLIGGLVAAGIAARMPNQFRATSTLSRTESLDLPNQRPKLPPIPTDALLALAASDTVILRTLHKIQEERSAEHPLSRPVLSAFAGAGDTFVLTATSTNSIDAQTFAAAWAHDFLDFLTQQRRNLISNSQAQNTQSILSFQRRLEQAQLAVDDFQRKNNVGPNFVKELRENNAAAVSSLSALLEEMRRLSSMSESGIGTAGPGNPAFDLRFEIRKLENRLAVTPTNAVLKAELELKRSDLKALSSLMQLAREEQLQDLQQRIQLAKSEIARTRDLELESMTLVVESTRLDEELARIKKHLDDLVNAELEMSRYYNDAESLQIVEAGGGVNVPVGPHRPRMVAGGIGFGAIAGLLLVIGRSLTRGALPASRNTPTRAPIA